MVKKKPSVIVIAAEKFLNLFYYYFLQALFHSCLMKSSRPVLFLKSEVQP